MDKENKSFMTRLAGFVVDRRRWILLLFAAMLVFSVFSLRWIKVEEDITAYLPEDAEAKQGLAIMEEEFITYGTAKVMVKNISLEDAKALSRELSQVQDVVLVQFDESASHYKDDTALFDLTFADVAASERSEEALERVKTLLGDRDVTIDTEIGFSLSDLVAEQMLTVLIFVVIVVLAVLVFTSSTYAEIPVMILTFMVAAVINIGTHFLMGTISFVSNSVAIVLQLALSVDYAIIFCNRYKEEHERLDIHDAVVKALAASIPEIFASSLTTIAGLTAMTFMKFRLGVDMGMTLIKAIFCSLLTVFFFMPALLMAFGKAMDKTKHRRFVPKITPIGKFAYKSRFVMPILLVLLVVGAYLTFSRVHYAYSVDMVPAFRQTEYERSKEEVREVFGHSNVVAVMVPSGDYAAERELLEELKLRPEVKSAMGLADIEAIEGHTITDEVDYAEFQSIAGIDEISAKAVYAYYAAEQGDHRAVRENLAGYKASLLDLFLFLHERVEAGDVELEEDQVTLIKQLFDQLSMVRGQLMSDNYSRLVLDLNLPVQSEETFRFLDQIHHIAAQYYDSGVVLTGDSVSALGFRDSFAEDNAVVGLMSLVLVMLILFFTFKSFGMPLLLILVIQGSIWVNFAIATLKGDYVFFLCYLIVSAIQMGANIDYAIVVSSRYREFRETMDKRDAIIETLNLAFPTIITSGLMMVCAGLLIGFQVSQCIIAGMGYYVGTGTSISLVLILFALPQVLLLGDSFVSATTLHTEKSRFLGFLAKNRLRIAGGLLAAAMLFAAATIPLGLHRGASLLKDSQERVGGLLEQTSQLRALAEKLEGEGNDLDSLKYDFAQQLVTDEVGSAQLAEGEQMLAENEELYNSGLAQYNEGAAQLADAQAQYDEGAARLAEAQAQYDAGLAAYNEGLAAYEEGQRQLAEGQAQYDAGLAAYEEGQRQLAEGQAQYDEGLAQYNSAKAALDAVEPLYDLISALQDRADALQEQYDAAMERGDIASALIIAAELAGVRASLEAELGGMSLGGLAAQYQEARAQLAAAEQQLAEGKAALDEGYAQAAAAEQQLAEGKAALDEGYTKAAEAEQQLAEGERKLAEGKAALDEGYAQLAEGGSQIAEGRQQLSDAHELLEEGGNQLEEGRQQLEEGRVMLEENLAALNDSLSNLDQLSDEMERLKQGLRLLKSEPGLKDTLSRNAGALETLDAAESYYRGLLQQAENENRSARFVSILMALSLICAVVSLVLANALKKKPLPAAILSAAAGLLSLMALVIWRSRCVMLGGLLPLAALILTICAALFSEFLFRKRRTAED